jgi:catechol 2,3-dioxygenase-like lactoylglutathione lyase family enzyme
VEQRISLITLGVAEVSRSCSFYERLGWATPCEEGAGVAFFPAGGLVFAVWDRSKLAADAGRTAAGAPGAMTLAHNVRSPAEVDAVLVEAEAAGATITQPARDTFWGATQAALPIRTAICGRWRTTPTGSSRTTGASGFRSSRAISGMAKPSGKAARPRT